MKSRAQGRTLKYLLHRVIVILVKAANLLWLLGTLQLSGHLAILRAFAGHHGQTTIGPQLTLAPEPVRRLHQGHQLRGPQWADKRNLAQQFHCWMFPAFGEQFSSHNAPQRLESVQLLIEQLCAAMYPGLLNLIQPQLAMTPSINLRAGAGNNPSCDREP